MLTDRAWRVLQEKMPGGAVRIVPRRVRGRIEELGPQVIVDPPGWVMRLCGDTLERRVARTLENATRWCEERNAAEAIAAAAPKRMG